MVARFTCLHITTDAQRHKSSTSCVAELCEPGIDGMLRGLLSRPRKT